MKKLIRSYYYASGLVVIGLVVTLIWFRSLTLWFSIAAFVSIVNYGLLILMKDQQRFTQQRLLLILLIRYIIFGMTCFLVIFLNRDSDYFIGIGIVLAIGLSVMKVGTICNTLIHKDEVMT